MSMVPTDSVLKRHYEQMAGTSGATRSSAGSKAASNDSSGGPCGLLGRLKKLFGG